MRLYLHGWSALCMLRYLRGIRDDRVHAAPVRVRSLAGAVSGARQLADLSPSAKRLLAHAGDTVHALVGEAGQRSGSDAVRVHLWSSKVPAGAFIRLTDDLYMSSPTFLFIQLARELELIELIKVGMELCGFYSLPERHTPYVPNSVDENEYGIQAAASARKICAMCESLSGAHGLKEARAAARVLADGSASPMETAVYLMLCLPKRLGGYGIPRPVFNPRVDIATSEGRAVRFPDLYWRDEAIDVEYQSDRDHSGEWKRYKDSKRQIELTTNRITVLPLTRAQVMNVDDFHAFAHGLKKLLGLRMRSAEPGWEYRRARLREALLARPR